MAIYTGEDKVLGIKVKDANGSYQNIDDMEELIVYLMARGSTVPLMKYKKTVGIDDDGFTELLRSSNTKYDALVPKSITKDFPIDELRIEVMVVMADERFDDGFLRTKGTGTVDEILKSNITE